MNFSAFEYWTDGWRDGSLMPNDEGLRQCKCGQYVLLRDMVEMEIAEASDLPRMDHVPVELLPDCIEKATKPEMEVAARLGYWRHLNHEYRRRYREYRDEINAEEKQAWEAEKVVWEAANPDRRTWWDKLMGKKPPVYDKQPDRRPFTCPDFEPTAEQLQNMNRLCLIFEERRKEHLQGNCLELAELYREQSRFDDAKQMIRSIDERDVDVTSKLISRLIKERQPAPTRYQSCSCRGSRSQSMPTKWTPRCGSQIRD